MVRLGKLILVLGAKFQVRPSRLLAGWCVVVSEPPRHTGGPTPAAQWGLDSWRMERRLQGLTLSEGNDDL